MSITMLGHFEISRLRGRYPDEFPFRDGPLPSQGSLARAASAWPTKSSTRPAGQHPYQPMGRYQQADSYQSPERIGPYFRTSPHQARGAPDLRPTNVQAGPGGYPSRSTLRRKYPWPLAIGSTVVPGIVFAAYALLHVSSPAAIDTSLSGIHDGQCIQYQPDPSETISSFPVIPCSAMHWGQFLGLLSIGDAASTPYPGDTVARQESAAVCAQAFNKAVGSNLRGYALWYRYPGQHIWENDLGSSAICIAEAGDEMPYEGNLSEQPEPVSPAREKAGPAPLSAVSLAGKNGNPSLTWSSTATPFTRPITTAFVLPPAPCGSAKPSDNWLGSSGTGADYQLTQGESDYAEVSILVAPLTQTGQESLPGYLRDLPRACYSPHWFSYQDGMNYTDDSAFTRPADGTRLLDMGYGKSGSPSYLEYWTVSDGYLLDFLYQPNSSINVASARTPMENALAAAVTHINSALHTHLRA
jgi:hypothetical protein